MAIGTMQDLSSVRMPSYWGFQHADWHDSCFQKCVVHGKICAVILCFTSELVEKICSDSLGGGKDNGDYPLSVQGRQMESVSRFCIYLLDKLYMQTNFSWEDTKVSFVPKHESFLFKLIPFFSLCCSLVILVFRP